MPTIYDVADAAGVSISTVSHVLNGTRRVSKQTEQRVLNAVKELNYRPNSLARALVRQETKTIALIIPDNVNPFYAEVARGVENLGFAAGYSVVLCNSDRSRAKEAVYLEMLTSKRVDGVILMTGEPTTRLQSLLEGRIVAVVFDSDRTLLDAVLLDNYGGSARAVQHLLELGHRRIACIRGPGVADGGSDLRVRAYHEMLSSAGLPVDPALLREGDWTYQSGKAATDALLKLDDPPTAIFACNDNMAIGALAALHEHGVSVPAAVSVVGFDGITLTEYTVPPLTTVATSLVDLGQHMCRLLLDRINGQLPDTPQRITVGNRLLIRGSTAPPPSTGVSSPLGAGGAVFPSD
ncbi:MAG TPA: LacI family DNA-binding transcriptional regulator [Caldilineaceae bacterium]|nr:LacI family DNA-binding transcriptional regulator [Caldilineaceae bacterium]